MKFIVHVKDLMDSLYSRGQWPKTFWQPLQSLQGSERPRFHYLHQEEGGFYEKGENVEIEMLMLHASNKYKTMVEAKTWNAPSPEDKKNHGSGGPAQDEEAQGAQGEPNKPNKPSKWHATSRKACKRLSMKWTLVLRINQ